MPLTPDQAPGRWARGPTWDRGVSHFLLVTLLSAAKTEHDSGGPSAAAGATWVEGATLVAARYVVQYSIPAVLPYYCTESTDQLIVYIDRKLFVRIAVARRGRRSLSRSDDP